jgi:hypothetical protein
MLIAGGKRGVSFCSDLRSSALHPEEDNRLMTDPRCETINTPEQRERVKLMKSSQENGREDDSDLHLANLRNSAKDIMIGKQMTMLTYL